MNGGEECVLATIFRKGPIGGSEERAVGQAINSDARVASVMFASCKVPVKIADVLGTNLGAMRSDMEVA